MNISHRLLALSESGSIKRQEAFRRVSSLSKKKSVFYKLFTQDTLKSNLTCLNCKQERRTVKINKDTFCSLRALDCIKSLAVSKFKSYHYLGFVFLDAHMEESY